MEHAQLAEFAATTSKNLMMETKFRMAAINSTQNYIMLAEASLKRDIESVSAKLDTERTDIKIMKDRNQTKFDSIDSMSATIIRLSQDIYEVQKTLESMESNLQQQKSNKSKTPPGNNVRQPDIVPPDIMDIDTITQLTTALSSTASKTKSKTVHFNEIADVKIIKCRPYSRMKTAKTNKQKSTIATLTGSVIALCNWDPGAELG